MFGRREQLNEALIAAAKAGFKENVLRLIGEGADVNGKGDYGNMPLNQASHFCHVAVVKVLIAKGGDVNATNNWGNTPLHSASEKGHVDVVKVLIANGGDVNATNNWGNTPR